MQPTLYTVTYLQEVVQPIRAFGTEEAGRQAKRYAAHNGLVVLKVERAAENLPVRPAA